MQSEELLKRDDETELQHHARLVYGKLEDKTLSDYDYEELSEHVYGKQYSSDVARRMMYGSRATLDMIERCGLNESHGDGHSDVLDLIKAEKIELQKERQRFFDQRREYNKMITSDGRFERLIEAVSKATENLNETVGVLYPSCYISRDCSSSEAILVFSDWHYGMVTKNAFNTYDTEECIKRVRHVVCEAIDKIDLHKCKTLSIVLLGDVIHGAIHTSARVASEELTCEQIMNVSEIIAQSIAELSGHVNETYVYSTYGNHARTVQNKNDSIHSDNMERLVPWYLEQRLKSCNNVYVVPQETEEFILFNVCGHDFCAAHGDLDAARTSTRTLTTLFHKKYGKDLEYVILGDKHHRESFEELGVTSMICGALCGSDDYANSKRLFSTPSQLLLIVDEEHGVDAEYRIKC